MLRGHPIARRERFCFVADRAAPTVLLLRGEDRPKEKREPRLSLLGRREAFAPGGLEDLLVEGCKA